MTVKRRWTPEAYLAKSRVASAQRSVGALERRLAGSADPDQARLIEAEIAEAKRAVDQARVHWEAERYISTLVIALEAPPPPMSAEQVARVAALAVHLVPARFELTVQ